jgi:hypothetical protein
MKQRILIPCLCALAALSACNSDSGGGFMPKTTVHVKAPVAPKAGPTPQEQTATMVEAATQGKSQAPVILKFDVLQRPLQGQPLEIGVALLPQMPASPLTVEVTGPDALQLGPGESQFEFAEVDVTQVYRHTVKLVPTAEGVYLLTFNVILKHDQTADSRVFSVPVIVSGNAATPAAAEPVASTQPPKANP